MARIGNNIYFRRSKGKWEGRFVRGRNTDGKLCYGYVSGDTEAECTAKRDLAAKAFAEEQKQAGMNNGLLFSAVAAQWLASESRIKKDSTICKYRNNLNIHLNPRFGDKIFSDIRREDVVEYIVELRNKDSNRGAMSTNTIKSIISVFRAVVTYGKSQYHLPTADFTGLFTRATEDIPCRLLTENEEAVLLEYILSELDSEKNGHPARIIYRTAPRGTLRPALG